MYKSELNASTKIKLNYIRTLENPTFKETQKNMPDIKKQL